MLLKKPIQADPEIQQAILDSERHRQVGKLMEELAGKSVTVTTRSDGMWEVEGKNVMEIDETLLGVLRAYRSNPDA